MNKWKYFEWMEDVMGGEFLNRDEVRRINVGFENEIGVGDRME